MERSAGILLPIFSLPGRYGIGSLGKEARAFADFLKEAGQKWWQILPVGLTDAGNSPYASPSTFAGNPLYIDLEILAEQGYLTHAELRSAQMPAADKVDYAAVNASREVLLRKAFSRLDGENAQAVRAFADENPWVKEFALYRAAHDHFGAPWYLWEDEALRRHEEDALWRWRVLLAEDVAFHTCVQYWFFTQWAALKNYVNGLGIKIIGDIPIYVSLDSADVWAEREQFLLDEEGRPSKVAGVPPDYFSEEGQLWGNPLYDYERMQQDGFGWWIRRVEGATKIYDIIRIDHFRGFAAYWSVPYGEKTAKKGQWVTGPGMALVGVLRDWFHNIRFIAEDLGYPSPDVVQLLADSGFPGMKVLEFAFDARDSSDYLPHTYAKNCVCYAGTHDNETLAGWIQDVDPADLNKAVEYLGLNEEEGYVWGLLRGGMSSVSNLFVTQMQDYLELDNRARMNTPGTNEGNWQWRMAADAITPELTEKIAKMTALYDR